MDYRYFMIIKHLCAHQSLHVPSPLLCHRNTSCFKDTLMVILYFMRLRYLVLMIYFMTQSYFYVAESLHVLYPPLCLPNTSCCLTTLMILQHFMHAEYFYAPPLLHVDSSLTSLHLNLTCL